MANIDQADDSKSLIDALRGNEKPLEARYAELAGYVGEADAQQTPESVLAMVQPTIMLTEEGAVDSGIGELMQGLAGMIDMETPSGQPTPMGQGVGELMMQGAGNTPPVNFNKGGEVRHYAPGGEVASGAAAYLPEFQKLYASVLGDPADREAELEEQKKLTKAQMLFDIAQTALAAGAPMDRPMSPAERLMTAAQSTQLFPRIGERAAAQLAAKQAQDKERRSMDLAALEASVAQATTDKAAADALALAAAKKSEETIKGVPVSVFNKLSKKDQNRILLGEKNTVNGVPRDIFDKLSADDKKLILGTSTEPTEVKGIPIDIFNKLSEKDQQRVVVGDPQGVNGIPRDIYDKLSTDDKQAVIGVAKGPVKGVPYSVYDKLSEDEKKRLVLGDPQGIKGIPANIFNTLDEDVKTRILGAEEGPIRGIPAKIFNELPKAQQTRVILGDPQGVNGIPRDIYNSLPEEDKKAILGTAPADVKGVPRDIYDTLTPQAQEAILGINVDIKGVPESIYNTFSEEDKKKIVGVIPVVADQKEVIKRTNKDGSTDYVLLNKTTKEEELVGNADNAPAFIPLGGSLVQLTGTATGKPEIVLNKEGMDSMFGGGDLGKAATYVSNAELLKKYADGTLNKEVDGISDSEMNTAFEIYTSPIATGYNTATKTYNTTPGRDLTEEMLQALRSRQAKGLSLPPKVILPDQKTQQLSVNNFAIDSGTLKLSPEKQSELSAQLRSPYEMDLNDAAFGSDTWWRKIFNMVVEAGSFGGASAPFKNEKNAITAVENLNQEFMSFFMAAQDIRDSVFQAEKLENLTPKPGKFWVGDDDAGSKALNLYRRIDRAIRITEYAIAEEEVYLKDTGSGSVSEKRQRLPQLYAMRHGYGILANIYNASKGEVDVEQQALIDDLNSKLGK
jgi:hypothetical protein